MPYLRPYSADKKIEISRYTRLPTLKMYLLLSEFGRERGGSIPSDISKGERTDLVLPQILIYFELTSKRCNTMDTPTFSHSPRNFARDHFERHKTRKKPVDDHRVLPSISLTNQRVVKASSTSQGLGWVSLYSRVYFRNTVMSPHVERLNL